MNITLRLSIPVLFFSLCLSYPLYAQKEGEISRYYSMKDGMSQDCSMSLLQDSFGYLWVGTYSGLNKFDGYQFTSYVRNLLDSSSLINNHVWCLWEDDFQRLWIGTAGGLQLFDIRTNQFKLFPNSSLLGKISINRIRERKDGKVWICTSEGVFLANPKTLEAERSIYLSGAKYKNVFWDIAEANDKTIWVGSGEGLLHMDAELNQISFYKADANDPGSLTSKWARSLLFDQKGRLWVGTLSGLDLYDPKTDSFKHYPRNHTYGDELRIDIKSLQEDTEGNIWIGSGRGLDILDPKTGKHNLLLEQDIWSFLEDRQGNTWIGAVNGLYQIAATKEKFKVIQDFGHSKVQDVRVLREDHQQQIWITDHYPEYQLFRYNPAAKEFTEYRQNTNEAGAFTGHGVRGTFPSSDGNVWIASHFKLEKFRPSDQYFFSWKLPVDPTTLLEDFNGRLWLGTWQEFGWYDLEKETFFRLEDFPLVEVKYTLEDTQKHIWIGTTDGLFRYNLQTGELDVFKSDPDDPYSISNNRVYHVMIDKSDNIWLSTSGGLNKIIPGTEYQNPKFLHWSPQNSGLPQNEVWCTLDGGDGTLWLTCGNQIVHFFPETGKFRSYDHHDGLHGQGVYQGIINSKGRIFLGSRDGMITFHPDSLQDNPYVPPIKFTNFTIHNQEVPVRDSYEDTLDWESPLKNTITHTKSVELPHWQNDFSLEFAALNYINPENNQYKYRLEPYEEEWVSTTADNRIARYTNLSPGEYTFRVKASNNDGIWNEAGTSLQLTILPPWWQTSGAYILYSLMGIGLLLGLRQYTVKRERLRHELNLQRMEAEKMHTVDQMKSRFFANISHEFRTPLTLIMGPLEKHLQETETGSKNYASFRMMRRNARRLLHLINQLLDLSKLEAGKMQLQASPQPIQSFLQPIGMSFSALAERKQVIYHFRYPKENPVLYFDADKMEKIITNLLSNAFKFTPAGEEITFTARLQPEKNRTKNNGSNSTAPKQILELEVKDSGAGMDEEQAQHIFQRFYQAHSTHDTDTEGSGIGLSLVKELVELHGGEITVSSEKGKGSCFTVSLPLQEADFAEFVSQPGREVEIPVLDKEAESEPESPGEGEASSDAPLLLVVEDNADVRAFICENLKSTYRLLEAANGREGYKKAVEHIPDLILSDVMMPEMDGVALCNHLKADEKTSHVPIILLTAKASGEDKIEGLHTGADDYVIKPFEAKELRARIDNLIENRRRLREQFSREILLQPSSIQITSADEQFLQRVIASIEVNMSNLDYGRDELCKEMHISPAHLNRKLKALTDHTPVELIRIMRMKRAAELLAAGAGNVGEISFAVGYKDHSYFSRSFHKQYGMSPSEYAASVAKKQ